MKKTKALLARLEALKTVNEETGEGYITFEALQERRLPAGTYQSERGCHPLMVLETDLIECVPFCRPTAPLRAQRRVSLGLAFGACFLANAASNLGLDRFLFSVAAAEGMTKMY